MDKNIIPKLSMKISSGGFNKFLNDGGGIDFRLNESCWSSLENGDIFELVEEPDENNRYNVKIIKLYTASSFSKLLDSLPNKLFDKSRKDAYLEFFSQWWSTEAEQQEGTLALHIEVLN